jgi:hypothetical protein
MISQQSTDKIINNENNPNSSIKKENDLKESETIDEKTLLKEKISLLPSDQKDILFSIENSLQNIDMQQVTIENQSINICDKISKYRILIIEEIFQLIYGINHFNPKVEYLCLINEIMKRNFGIEKNESDYKNIIQTMKEKFYPYIKGICVDLFWGLDKYNQDAVYYYLNEWDKNKYIKNEFIKEIKFELKMRNDPQITGNKEELNFLVNFVNYSGFKIEPSLIDFSKQTETLDRTKDNKQRKIMLKMEKDLIQKQLRMYNTHIQQLKEVNLLLNKIKENPNLLAEKQ